MCAYVYVCQIVVCSICGGSWKVGLGAFLSSSPSYAAKKVEGGDMVRDLRRRGPGGGVGGPLNFSITFNEKVFFFFFLFSHHILQVIWVDKKGVDTKYYKFICCYKCFLPEINSNISDSNRCT